MKAGEPEAAEASRDATPTPEVSRWVSIVDFILRIAAATGTLGSAIAMGTTNETLLISTQFAQLIQFRAEYDDLPAFTFFVTANSIVCGYLVLSLPLSIFHIIHAAAKKTRIFLVIFDTLMLALVTSGASAAAAIVYLAHKGNANANWSAICGQFNSFCELSSRSLIGSFGAVVLLMLIIITSAVTISQS